MPRCSHCGKVNREGSLFCQDCGHKIEAAPATAKPAQATGPVCGACGTVNPPGMNFCKMCGTSLAAKQAAAVASTMMAEGPPPSAAPASQAAASGKVSCPACGKQTPAGFAFCQHCGQRLQASQPQAQAAAPRASGSQPAPMINPTPPAGMPRPQVAPAAERPVTSSRNVSSDDAMAKTMAPSSEMVAQMRAQVSAARPAAAPKVDTMVDEAPPVQAEKRFGSLVAVNRDGSDGQKLELTGEAFDIGRSEGRLNFDADPYLAPRHARLVPQNGKVILRPIDSINGVYVRVHGTCDLNPGDLFLVGKEVIRYEPCVAEERELPSLVEHGVRLFGSAPREAWGRLRQVSIAGTTRDVWHLTRPELVLGREEGDVTFPDDEFMSRRHAAVKRVGQKARLEDLNSSNGTFVRVKGDRELAAGDVLRLGDQLMRFEP
jgi:pSer/pThr/pTyr-binding forkhead associated (FHA) protein